MSPDSCDRCGAPFDPANWHPAAFGDGTVYGFCSRSCKRAFLAAAPFRDRPAEEDAN